MTIGILLYALAAGAVATFAGWGLATILRLTRTAERWVWALSLLLAAALCLAPLALGPTSGPDAASPPGAARASRLADAIASARGAEQSAAASPGSRDWVGALAGLARLDPSTEIPGGGTVWWTLSIGLLVLALVAEVRHARRTSVWARRRLDGRDVWIAERAGPAVCGAIRPRMILPARIDELPPDDRALVVAHEAEHLRAQDPRLNGLAFLAVAAAPWNPFLWVLRHRLANAIESDCDARVLAGGAVDGRHYVEVLLRVASWIPARAPVPLSLAMGRSARELRDRVIRVVGPPPPRSAGVLAAALLVGVGALGPLLGHPPRPAAPGVERTGVALSFGSVPAGAAGHTGRAAFVLELARDGSVAAVRTEAILGDEGFGRVARSWLSGARATASRGGRARVWVVARNREWSVTPVSEAIYERERLAERPDRALALMDVVTRPPRGGAGSLPVVSSGAVLPSRGEGGR